MTRALPSLIAVLVLAAPAAAAGDGLPVGNIDVGRVGVAVPGVPDRIIALARPSRTLVLRTAQDGGQVQSTLRLRGQFTVPGVALDATADGRSYDGRTVVLIRPRPHLGVPQRRTRLAVLSVRPLKLTRRITLRGDFSFDALSADGRRLFLVNYYDRRDLRRYRVRSLDLRTGKLEPGAIVDASEPDEDMRGYPITRATSPDGRWVYTLYDGAGEPFVHALDTEERKAHCIDLPLLAGTPDPFQQLRLRLGPGGLSVLDGGKPAADVDTTTFAVSEPAAAPAPAPTPRERPAPAEESGGVDWWVAGFFVAFGLGVLALARRRRRRVRVRR